jgi:hypothetical protein
VGGRTLLHAFFVLSYDLGADLMFLSLGLRHLLRIEEHCIGFLIVESNLNRVQLRSAGHFFMLFLCHRMIWVLI